MSLNFVDNKLLQSADSYIRDKRIIELFEVFIYFTQDLATALAYRQPENVEEFLIDLLAVKKEQGLKSGFFTESEVQNVFNLFDLKKEGLISKERCKKGKFYM